MPKSPLKEIENIRLRLSGGKGSGHHGHKGRPGKRGGSTPRGGGGTATKTKAPKTYEGVYKKLIEQGGFTYQPIYDIWPETGFMVSPYSEREKVIPMSAFSRRDLRKYVNQNADLLGKDDHYLGGWVYEGNAYLDISIRSDTKEQANRIAKENNQIAFFDLSEMEEIKTNILRTINLIRRKLL